MMALSKPTATVPTTLREHLKQNFGSFKDVASVIGVDPANVSQWIARNNVPHKHREKLGLTPSGGFTRPPVGVGRIDVNALPLSEARRIYEELKTIFGGVA